MSGGDNRRRAVQQVLLRSVALEMHLHWAPEISAHFSPGGNNVLPATVMEDSFSCRKSSGLHKKRG